MRAGGTVRALRTLRRDDAGFTLIELLVSVVILGIISAPLAGVVIAYLRNSDATAARMNDSHSAQIAGAYFIQDVQSLGVRAFTAPPGADGSYPLQKSVETAASGGDLPCGVAGSTNVVRLAWDDFPTVPTGTAEVGTSSTLVVAAYVLEGTDLHRLLCVGSSAPASDVRLAENVESAVATCSSTCTGTGTAVPTGVSLRLSVRDPHSASAYTVTLTGQRRQT